eukprot:355368-Chlamydomonas_euryale.AAC.8
MRAAKRAADATAPINQSVSISASTTEPRAGSLGLARSRGYLSCAVRRRATTPSAPPPLAAGRRRGRVSFAAILPLASRELRLTLPSPICSLPCDCRSYDVRKQRPALTGVPSPNPPRGRPRWEARGQAARVGCRPVRPATPLLPPSNPHSVVQWHTAQRSPPSAVVRAAGRAGGSPANLEARMFGPATRAPTAR